MPPAGVPNANSESRPPEWREDPVTGRWHILATGRAARPHDVNGNGERTCPFCEGQEHETPGEVLAHRAEGSEPDGPGWDVRVVPNKFPALDWDLPAAPANVAHAEASPLARAKSGMGRHEVIIESPRHVQSFAELSVDEVLQVLGVWRERMLDLSEDPRLAYALIFKNQGVAAGASLAHTHSQLVATASIPESVREELTGAERYHARTGTCVYCDLIAEAQLGSRLISKSSQIIAFAPFASRFPFETWVLPQRHSSRFELQTEAELAELASMIFDLSVRLHQLLKPAAYNLLLHTAPFRVGELAHYHWHVEILPRVTNVAGFEWGAGACINVVAPEAAAERLRNLDPQIGEPDSEAEQSSTD